MQQIHRGAEAVDCGTEIIVVASRHSHSGNWDDSHWLCSTPKLTVYVLTELMGVLIFNQQPCTVSVTDRLAFVMQMSHIDEGYEK